MSQLIKRTGQPNKKKKHFYYLLSSYSFNIRSVVAEDTLNISEQIKGKSGNFC